MAYPSQQPGFDPNQQPPQGQPGGPPAPQPGYGPPPPWYGQPGYPPRRRASPGAVFGLLMGAMVLIIVVGLLIGNGVDDGEPSASDSPEDVVEQYLDAQIAVLESGGYVDFEDIADAIGPYLCSDVRAEMSEALENLDDPDVEATPLSYSDFDVDYEITGSLVEEDVAVVYVEITGEASMDGYVESLDTSDSVDLVREDGTWLVCDGSAGTYV